MDPTREQLEAMLADYVDGNLHGEELARAEAFLNANPGVRDVMGRLMVDSEAIRTLPRVAPPVADLSEDLRGQLERNMLLGDGGPSVEPAPRRVSTQALAVAAILVVGIGASVAAWIVLGNRPEPTIFAQNDKPTVESTSRPSTANNSRSQANNRGAARRAALDQSAAAKAATQLSQAARETRDAANLPMANSGGAGGGSNERAIGGVMNGGTLTLDQSASSVRLSGETAPADIVAWVAAHGAQPSSAAALSAQTDMPTTEPSPTLLAEAAGPRRAIVFVVETAGDVPADRKQVAESAASFFRSNLLDADGTPNVTAATTRGALANASFGAAADGVRDREFAVGAEREIASNVATTSPIAQAMDDANAASAGAATQPALPTTTPTLLATNAANGRERVESSIDAGGAPGTIARDVPEAVAAQWQGQIAAMPMVAHVDTYAIDVPTPTVTPVQTQAAGLGFGAAIVSGPATAPTTAPSTQADSLAQAVRSLPQANAAAVMPAGGMSQVSGVPLEQQQQRLQLQTQAVQASNVDVYVIVRPTTQPPTQP